MEGGKREVVRRRRRKRLLKKGILKTELIAYMHFVFLNNKNKAKSRREEKNGKKYLFYSLNILKKNSYQHCTQKISVSRKEDSLPHGGSRTVRTAFRFRAAEPESPLLFSLYGLPSQDDSFRPPSEHCPFSAWKDACRVKASSAWSAAYWDARPKVPRRLPPR